MKSLYDYRQSVKRAAEFGQGPVGIKPVAPPAAVPHPGVPPVPPVPTVAAPAANPPVTPPVAAAPAVTPAPQTAPQQPVGGSTGQPTAQKVPEYQTYARGLLTGSGADRAEAFQKYHDWAAGASDEERSAAQRYLAREQVRGTEGWAAKIPGVGGVMDKYLDDRVAKLPQEELNQKMRDAVRSEATKAGQGVSDQASKEWAGEKGGMWNYISKNPSLMMIPLGILGMLSGNNAGRMMGLMAMFGGAMNLNSRYKSLKDPGFLKAVQLRVAGQQTKSWQPEQEQQFQASYAQPWQDLQAGQAGGLIKLPSAFGDEAVKQMESTFPGAPRQPAQQPAAPVQPPVVR